MLCSKKLLLCLICLDRCLLGQHRVNESDSQHFLLKIDTVLPMRQLCYDFCCFKSCQNWCFSLLFEIGSHEFHGIGEISLMFGESIVEIDHEELLQVLLAIELLSRVVVPFIEVKSELAHFCNLVDELEIDDLCRRDFHDWGHCA